MTTRAIALSVFSLILIASGFFLVSERHESNLQTSNHTISTGTSTSVAQNATNYAGIISTNASGQRVYTNDKYGFQFTYPANWRVGDNALGMPNGGTLQLLNSSKEDVGQSHGFARGENKIEAAVINTESSSAMLSSSNPDSPAKSIEPISLSVLNGTITGVNVELIGGEKSRTYSIPLRAAPDKSLLITIYGEASNFYALDTLVKSITWKY